MIKRNRPAQTSRAISCAGEGTEDLHYQNEPQQLSRGTSRNDFADRLAVVDLQPLTAGDFQAVRIEP